MQTARYQRKLLRVAVQLLKPGGHLVYSTCTINPGMHDLVALKQSLYPSVIRLPTMDVCETMHKVL